MAVVLCHAIRLYTAQLWASKRSSYNLHYLHRRALSLSIDRHRSHGPGFSMMEGWGQRLPSKHLVLYCHAVYLGPACTMCKQQRSRCCRSISQWSERHLMNDRWPHSSWPATCSCSLLTYLPLDYYNATQQTTSWCIIVRVIDHAFINSVAIWAASPDTPGLMVLGLVPQAGTDPYVPVTVYNCAWCS